MPRKVLTTLDLNGPLTLTGAAGTNGQVLTSGGSGTTPTWTTVSGGSSPTTSFSGTRRILTGYAYTPYETDWSAIYGGGTDTYSKSYSNGTMIAIPFMMPEAATATSLSIYCTGAIASSVWRLGIYNNSASGDYPDTRLLDAGTVSTATTGVKTITISQSLSANTLYWLVAALNTGTNVTLYCAPYNALSAFMPQTTVATISGVQGYFTGWSQTGVTGALPASFTATKTGFRQAPLIWIGF